MTDDINPTCGFQQNWETISDISGNDDVEHKHGESFTWFSIVVLSDLWYATGKIEEGGDRSNYVAGLKNMEYIQNKKV